MNDLCCYLFYELTNLNSTIIDINICKVHGKLFWIGRQNVYCETKCQACILKAWFNNLMLNSNHLFRQPYGLNGILKNSLAYG